MVAVVAGLLLAAALAAIALAARVMSFASSLRTAGAAGAIDGRYGGGARHHERGREGRRMHTRASHHSSSRHCLVTTSGTIAPCASIWSTCCLPNRRHARIAPIHGICRVWHPPRTCCCVLYQHAGCCQQHSCQQQPRCELPLSGPHAAWGARTAAGGSAPVGCQGHSMGGGTVKMRVSC